MGSRYTRTRKTCENCRIVEFLIHVSLRVVALLASYMM